MAEYIEREMTIALLRERGLEAAEVIGQVFSNGIFDAVRFLNEQPAADVAPVVHGHWTYDSFDESAQYYHCDKCGEKIALLHEGELIPNYCPYCGAKMQGDYIV